MPPAKPKRRTSTDPSMPLNPKDQQKFVELLKKLHMAVNSGNVEITMQAMPKLMELHERFPKNVNVLVLIGRGYMAIRNLPKSIEFYRKAIGIMPMEPDINFQYGLALENQNLLDQALDRFDRVLQKQPDNFYAMRHRTSTLDGLGRRQEAYEGYVEIVEKFKDAELDDNQLNALAITAAAFAPDYTDPRESLEGLEERIEATNDPDLLRAGSIQLARLHKLFDDHDEAFGWYERGKAVDRDDWDSEKHSANIDELIRCWSGGHEIPFSQAKNIDASRLVFIVGMPRSGTSLTEQMLSQLKDIEPGGEMNVIDAQIHRSEKAAMRHSKPLPISPHLYTQPVIDSMSKDAMKAYNKVHRRKSITDKQPYNYLLVPMIAHILPGAKIIHCTRDPLDCCFSNYTTAFTQLHMQTHDQYWLGRYFADYERVMDAWHQLPEVEMIDLPYEELVRDAEGQMRRVVEFIGHEWDDSILRFHESERKVITASRDQVKKKLYTSSIAKYAPYEHRLDELKRGLEEGRAREIGGKDA
jgi:tetratricopeptide (TPR) repeat protein